MIMCDHIIFKSIKILIVSLLVFPPWLHAKFTVKEDSTSQSIQVRTFKKEITKTANLNYLLYLPSTYEESGTQWPLLIFLHGDGAQHDINLIRKYGPPKLLENGKKIPAILLTPQLPGDVHWDPDALYALSQQIIEEYRIDTNRIYLTGLSRGGFGSWEFAVSYPDFFAAVVPISARGISGIERLKHCSIWIFHGEKDQGVPVDDAKWLYRELIECGADVRITVYPDLGHNIEDRAYNDPLLWKWLFQQKKNP